MKMPHWIKRVLHRGPMKGFNPCWFVSQYRVKLVREGGLPLVKYRIDDAEKAHSLVRMFIESHGQSDRKQFVVLMLTEEREVIGLNMVATGSASTVAVGSREILKPAILTNASAIILCHSQPNGDVKPSDEDLAYNEKIVWAAGIFGVRVIDHLIISTADESCFSFTAHGIIQKIYQSMNKPKSAGSDNEEKAIIPRSATLH
jgi:DNA repair protein RadC